MGPYSPRGFSKGIVPTVVSREAAVNNGILYVTGANQTDDTHLLVLISSIIGGLTMLGIFSHLVRQPQWNPVSLISD